MSATHAPQSTVPQGPVLYMAIELSLATWKLAFTVGSGQKPRLRLVTAGALICVLEEIESARKRFKLPEDATAVSCYEAGRDGFWIHRFLISEGIESIVVDWASIQVSRRKRRAKSDRLDATKLVSMLIRWHNGEKMVWVVCAPFFVPPLMGVLHQSYRSFDS
jgi:transposase